VENSDETTELLSITHRQQAPCKTKDQSAYH